MTMNSTTPIAAMTSIKAEWSRRGVAATAVNSALAAATGGATAVGISPAGAARLACVTAATMR